MGFVICVCVCVGFVICVYIVSFIIFILFMFFLILYYVFLLLRLCILIVMYLLCCIFSFLRANWHSSYTLVEVFLCFSSAVEQMSSITRKRRGTAGTLPKLIVSFCVLCVNVYCITATVCQPNYSYKNISASMF